MKCLIEPIGSIYVQLFSLIIYYSLIAKCCAGNNSPVVALLTREALQVVDVISGPHHHFERWNHLRTCRTVTCCAEQSAQVRSLKLVYLIIFYSIYFLEYK